MNTEIGIALIGFLGTVVGTFGGIVASAKLTVYRIAQLEKKVESLGGLVERTYRVEENQTLFKEQLKIANHRISDLENGAIIN